MFSRRIDVFAEELLKEGGDQSVKRGLSLALYELVHWRVRELHPDEWDRALHAVIGRLASGDRKDEQKCKIALRQLCRDNVNGFPYTENEDNSLVARILNGQFFEEFAAPDTQEGVI